MQLPPIPTPDTLRGIDDLIRGDLEAYRDFWFHQLLLATLLVVVGLVLEGPELWYEIISIIRQWCSMPKFSTPEKHAPNWVKLLAFIGWLLIVGGVAGEYVADSFVSKADGFVQKFDEILLADAQKRTGAASERAAKAFERAAQTEREASQENERAAKALKAAETARKSAEGFQLQIAQANERAAQAEKDAAEANKAAESERIERLKLQASIAGRRLTAEQKEKLTSLLKPFAPTMIGLEWTGPGSQEAADLASDFNDVIVSAGIPIAQANRNILMDQYFKGVLLKYGVDRKMEAEAIAGFLIEAHLSPRPVPALPPDNPQQLAIIIGAKP